MTEINAFMVRAADRAVVKEVKLSETAPIFKIKALTGAEMDMAQKLATVRKTGKGGRQEETQDMSKLQDTFIEMAVVSPNLNDEQIQEAMGTFGNAADTAREMLMAGEYANLLTAIQDHSGFEQEAEIEDLKN